MGEIVQISTDANVIELIELLKKNQMEREAANVVDLVSYIDVLTSKLELMSQQLDELRNEVRYVKETQDNTFEVKLNHVEAKLEEVLNRLSAYMIEQTQHRIDSIKKNLQVTKQYIKDKAKEIVSDFRTKGKKALFKVSELLHVRPILSGIRNSVEIGILETNDFISRIDDFGKYMREAKLSAREVRQERGNAVRSLFGKEQKEYDNSEKNKKFSKTELAKKPWRWQRGVYESIKLFLDSSIDKLNSLEMAVKESISKAPDYEVDERIFSGEVNPLIAVVAESDHKYGADAFEDHMKSVGAKTSIMNSYTPKPHMR